jgi:transglutaminase-like putative cysteine protease
MSAPTPLPNPNLPPPTPNPIRYQVLHATNYFYSEPVPLCQNEVHLRPRDTSRQKCLTNRLDISPPPHKLEERRDYFGNPIHFFTLQDRHRQLSVAARSEVEITSADYLAPDETESWERVRDRMRGKAGCTNLAALEFTFDSPHVTASPELAEFASASFTPGRPWLEATLDLMARIYHDFSYDETATNVSTPLETVLAMRRGVCQDFAHLQIGCLRSLGLPARYVSGYLLTTPPSGQPKLVGADASHAWTAAWCEEYGWVDFDPTNDIVPSMRHVTVAWGRDYSDVCPIKGVFIGGGDHSMDVSVDVEPIDRKRRPRAGL